MVPRTSASAWLSDADRRPSRLWSASRTLVATSCVSVGSAVWLSKGSSATVLMDGGSPPPAKPYRQPLRAAVRKGSRRLRLAISPDLRRKVGPRGRKEGEIELGRHAGHYQPRGERGARAVERGLRPPDDLAAVPHLGHQLAPFAGGAHIAHRVGGTGILPGGDGALAHPAELLALGRLPGDAEHGPHERVVGNQLLDRVGRLGPERLLADHRGRRGAGAERARDIEPHGVRG